MTLEKTLRLLQEKVISLGKAAEMEKLTIYELMQKAHEFGISICYREEDLARDVKRFKLDKND